MAEAVFAPEPEFSEAHEAQIYDLTVDESALPDQVATDSVGLWAANRRQLSVKRLVDVVVASLLLVAMLPLFVLVVIAVGGTSRGPVFFRQERVGRFGRKFRIWKFRSMYANAEARRAELLPENERDGPVFKIRRDPRITPVGRVLRKLSIDELPQLYNVVRGEMSLVGPRPPLPEEVAWYGARERLRLTVQPGLTCTWQVSGRSEIDFATWTELDIDYIRSWSPWLDVKLILKTIPAVVTGRGAY